MQILKILALLYSLSGVAMGAEWCYKSQVSCDNSCKGPDEWKDVASTCGGKKQSPINIVTRKVTINHLPPFKFDGYQHAFESIITNNGHTVKLNLSGEAVISNAGLTGEYKAVEVHFHWGKNGGPGSEHTIDGEQYPMEMHIVHIKKSYSSVSEATKDPLGLAVLGMLYQESPNRNMKYDSIINALSSIKYPGNKTTVGPVSLDSLLPPHCELMKYFRYNGSLTTPNCSESVIWTVFENTTKLSKQQLSAFSDLWFDNRTAMTENFRPVQPLNGRNVFYSGSSIASVSTVLVVSISIITFLNL
ncbi:carbonic anhydrase 4b [Silurus meridionalis]|uniref:Carbonic anhydrase n=1 Tax=Silurus meridionalis TaxID=175797 RepID=A0A8T0B2E6_SILME|nr:carbonic anhydrase 4b [Silurus meridionalis]KAF7699831.1 hypothetical protein HF521_002789 [Silurus meridionalis]